MICGAVAAQFYNMCWPCPMFGGTEVLKELLVCCNVAS